MAHVLLLSDEQLERICAASEQFCGLNCRACEAFQANRRFNEGYCEDYEDGEEYES